MADLIHRKDAIHRQDAIQMIKHKAWLTRATKAQLIVGIAQLPSAQPERMSCDGCKFCGTFENQFPCNVCIRREKDYYERLD